MAYICNKPKGSCPICPHYRKDEDYPNRMACYAAVDEKKKMASYTDATVQHLIDANHLIHVLEAGDDRNIISTIMNQPVIEQRVHAHWIEEEYFNGIHHAKRYRCSKCGLITSLKYDYCHCGAQMDLGPNSHRVSADDIDSDIKEE